jgi:hypothetical protein
LTSVEVAETASPEAFASGAAWRPLLWLNLWCLDAPLVAIAWQWVFARSAHVTTSPAQIGALFLTAWLIYLADRLADSISSRPNVARSARKVFCAAHRNVWIFAILIIALVDSAIVGLHLDRATVTNGILLGVAAIVYLATNLFFSRIWEVVPIKEIVIGILFATGTLLILAEAPAKPEWPILLGACLFAALCAINCISIAVWERELDQAHGECSIATRWPRIRALVPPASIALMLIAWIFALADHSTQIAGIGIGLSAAFLTALHFIPIDRDERTALADLVLLTPVFFFFLEKSL